MKPNIIILISDALRPKDLSLYGRSKIYDSNLKRFASESTLFMKNFAVSTGSDPSNTSLFSGQYPTTSGFIHQHPFMRQKEVEKLKKNPFWLPLYLQREGYQTISATPLHLWFKKGFDSYTDKDSLKSGRFLDIPIIKRFLLALPNWAYSLGKRLVKLRASPQFYPCNKVMDFAIGKIREMKEKPFFLFMHMVDTHYPYAIAPIKNLNGSKTAREVTRDLPAKQREYIKKRFFDLNARNMEQIEQKRDDSIEAFDMQVRRLHEFLKREELWDNTLVVILADHGDNFGEHETYFCRGGLYDPSVHVPLIIHFPKIRPSVVQGLTQTIDIPATILDMLKGKKYKIDGKSLMGAAKNGKSTRESVFFTDAFCDKRYAVRTKSEKFIFNGDSVCYLCGARHAIKEKESYNLTEDYEEIINIYPEHKDMERLAKSSYNTNVY